ncbi:MAG: cyanophycinase [bacterium]|nr:cyanophycinase [bacterium]
MLALRLPATLISIAAALAAQAIPDPAGVTGTRIIAGGGRLPATVHDRFLELAGGATGKILIVPTASRRADTPEGRNQALQQWRAAHPGHEFAILHTRERTVADTAGFCAPLRTATGVWFGGGSQRRIAAAYVGTRVERELVALLARGGVVGGSSAGAAVQSRTMIQSGRDEPVMARGFDFVPGAIIDQHFLARERLPRLRRALAAQPGHFGVGIDEGCALEFRGRGIRCLGTSKALLILPRGGGREERFTQLMPGDRADLVSLQRAAIARRNPPWPPTPMARPVVANGTLVIAGGGRLPATVIDRFVTHAGGDDAVVVVIPTASPARGPRRIRLRSAFEARGAEVHVLDRAHPSAVETSDLELLAKATGVWFGGGRQWRLCDAFEGTPVIAALHAVLARDGVIGGSSAGATIQGEFLVRGNPLGNRDEWCEGYERGFGFLPGCAIDQHFVARNRTADLRGLIEQLPQLIGLGVDEGTAAIVRGSELEVVGASKVAVFDHRKAAAGPAAERAKPQPIWLEPGQRWDLAARARR